MFDSLATATVAIAGGAYTVAALLFILRLRGPSHPESPRTRTLYALHRRLTSPRWPGASTESRFGCRWSTGPS